MTADDLAKILDELGQRLGPTGQHVFELAVRQQIIEGAVSLGLFVVGLLICAGTVARFAKDWTSDTLTARGAFFVVGAFVVLVGGAIFLGHGVGQLLNPEYAALSDLLSKVVPK